MHRKLRECYGAIVSESGLSKELQFVAYSIMIVENFNRPRLVRLAEAILGRLREHGTYGIMQIKNHSPLSDAESVIKGVGQLRETHAKVAAATNTTFERMKAKTSSLSDLQGFVDRSVLERVAWLHNRSDNYSRDVIGVYEILMSKIGQPVPQKTEEDRYDALWDFARRSGQMGQ
jgi:hypothetical protein